MAVNPASGTLLKNGTNTITQVIEITPPHGTNPSLDTTDLDDTNRKYTSTLPDPGTFMAKLNYDAADTQHAALYAAWAAGTALTMHVVLTDSGDADVSCPCYISDWNESALTPGGKAEVTITFQLTTLPTVTA